MRKIAFALLTGAAVMAGCGGDDAPASPTPTASAGPGELIEITAQNNRFNTDLVTVDAGAQVQIEFRSNDAAPHNIAIYETAAAEVEIFVGDIVIGPREVELFEFDAPLEPGTYFFRCDVHPIEMIGDFVVL